MNPRIKAMQRMWLGYKSDCEVDGAGRVVLTPEMRDYAKLDRKVQMIGQGDASNSGANAAGRTSSSWHNARCVKTRPPSWPACPYEWRPMQPGTHISVLLREACDALLPERGGTLVDGTFGRGGHSRELLRRMPADARLIAVDRDAAAAAEAARIGDPRFHFCRCPLR